MTFCSENVLGLFSGPSRGARKVRAPLLAPLVVLSLIACHGALGGAHLLVVEPIQPAPAHAAPSTGESLAENPPEHSFEDLYYAAFFVTLFGSLLSLLFRGVGGPRPTAAFSIPSHCSSTRTFRRRGSPTRPLLQVFRL